MCKIMTCHTIPLSIPFYTHVIVTYEVEIASF